MRMWCAIATAALLVCSGAGASAASSVRLVVTPSTTLVDRPVRVRLTGVHSRKVVLEATMRDSAGLWRSRLVFRPNRAGVVDTRGNMQLFWSMQPLHPCCAASVVPLPLGRTAVHIRALVSGRRVATAALHWVTIANDVTQTPTTLGREGFVGTYYSTPSTSPEPALLVLGGSEGGLPVLTPRLLASHGYPTLALAYFREPGLPKTLKDIPLEYFANALRWLAAQPGVDPTRVVVAGVSRGGEAALLIGSTYPNLEDGVLAYTPSSDVNGAIPGPGDAWTLAGKPIPEGPIAVERIGGPVIATGGGRDAVWQSGIYVSKIVQRARKYGRRDIVGRTYRNAGHAVGYAAPNFPEAAWNNLGGTKFSWAGGTIAANERARIAAWRLCLQFIATLPRRTG
jgi:dienelactone hydrolase